MQKHLVGHNLLESSFEALVAFLYFLLKALVSLALEADALVHVLTVGRRLNAFIDFHAFDLLRLVLGPLWVCHCIYCLCLDRLGLDSVKVGSQIGIGYSAK